MQKLFCKLGNNQLEHGIQPVSSEILLIFRFNCHMSVGSNHGLIQFDTTQRFLLFY